MSMTQAAPKFWSDDFDVDLLKVFPGAPKMLAYPEATLWTVGHESYGRLNHPVVWDSHAEACIAFAWLEKPNLERDKHGWFNIGGHVADEPEIECTWIEWLRDCWPHRYITQIRPIGATLPPPPQPAFDAIMYDLRGWRKAENLQEHRKSALHWLMRCEFIFNEALKRNPS